MVWRGDILVNAIKGAPLWVDGRYRSAYRAWLKFLLRVINGPVRPEIQRPVCPRKRTQVGHRLMSGLGQKATFQMEQGTRRAA